MRYNFPADDPPGFVGLRYFAPPEGLREAFGPAYLFAANQAKVSDVTRADFPQLRFMLSGTGSYRFHDSTTAQTPACCLLGPTLGATRFEVDGPLQVLGVSILPLGWAQLGLGEASAAADGVSDAAGMFGPEAGDLLARVNAMDDPESGVAALWDFLADRVSAPPRALIDFIALCDAWLVGERSPSVGDLVARSGLSARQVARLTNRIYGASPKYLARKFRALRCAAEIALDQQQWTEMVDGIFYDQSHFIREIRHFIGLTPNQLKTEPTIVARLTLQRRAMGASVAEINRIS